MKKLILLLLLSSVFAQTAYFFYGQGCPHCARAMPTIDNLIDQGYDIQKKEVYQNPENAKLLNKYFDNLSIPMLQRGVPFFVHDNQYLVGDSLIIEKSKAILDGEIINEGTGSTNGITKESVSIWVLTGAALVDSINPCAIAVLLILLSALMVAGEKKKALISGLAFTASIYLSYLLFGLGLFSAIQYSGLSNIIYQFVGALAIIIGLANLKDYFWYGAGGFVMEVPMSWRPALKKILNNVTGPLGAFLAGFLVCLFELPCTGGPYLFILGLLAEKTTQAIAIPLLVYYNLVFVIPLVIITGIFYFQYSKIEQMNAWKEKNLRALHLIAGIIMLGLGIAVLTGTL